MTTRPYGSKTHLGNWAEERELRRAQVREYTMRREAGMTLGTQRLAQLRGSGKPVQLSPCDGGVLHYGDVVQFRNERTGLLLSVDLLEVLRTDPDSGEEHRAVTTSPTAVTPTIRNAFVVVPAGGQTATLGEDGVVRYGEAVALASHPECPLQLFVSSNPRTPTIAARASGHQECVTAQRMTYSCAWRFVFIDPQLRMENEGQPVKTDAKLVMIHAQTGVNLAADNTQANSDYGLEFEVFCRNVLDFKKAELPDNIWTIVLGAAPQP